MLARMNVYQVDFDIKLGREWISRYNSRQVAVRGDARDAINKVESVELKQVFEGKRPTGFRVTKVVQIAADVLT